MEKNNSHFKSMLKKYLTFLSKKKAGKCFFFSSIVVVVFVFFIIFIKSYSDDNAAKSGGFISVSDSSSGLEPEECIPSATDSIEKTMKEATNPSHTESLSELSIEKVEETAAISIDPNLRKKALNQLTENIEALLDEKLGRYGVYYLNLKNDESIELFAKEPFVAASTMKLAYNTYLYQEALAGSFSMNEKIAFNVAPYPRGDYEEGTGEIQNKPHGTEFTLSEISHLSIYVSDNCATNMMLRKLGGIEIVNENYLLPIGGNINYHESVSYVDHRGIPQAGIQRTSAMDLGLYAKNLYALYQENKNAYRPLINDLSKSVFTWGISDIETAPEDPVLIAHKIGSNGKFSTFNDAGIVFAAEDYILAIVTENHNGEVAQQMIGQVSQMVYDYVQMQAGYRYANDTPPC